MKLSTVPILLVLVILAGCARPTAAVSVPPRVEGIAFASSDLGYRLDPTARAALLYEPVYDPSGEEKIRPPRHVSWPLPEDFRLMSVSLEGHHARARFRDAADRSAWLEAGLGESGREVSELWTIPTSVKLSKVEPPLVLKSAGEEASVYRRALTATAPASGPAIPRPYVKITIDSDDSRDNRVAGAILDDLVTAVHPRLRRSIAPMGLTSEIYFGHVFWDADVWVFPALALLDPEAAAEIPAYRLRTVPGAIRNFETWVAAGRPTATGKLGAVDRLSYVMGMKFAWESSETGLETVPGPSRFEDHISGSVLWSLGLASDLDLMDPVDFGRPSVGVGTFYALRRESTKRGLEIKDTVSPDEHHTGDNDLYTNLVAQQATLDPFYLPRDAKSFLTYDGDRIKGYKQAAALLAVYPLQYPPAEKEASVLLDRFAPAVIPNGPAMTDAIHAIVAARVGQSDRALGFWRRSWEGFYDLDRGMFSERRKGTRREYFYTGAAGTLQAVLYGFVGLRVDKAGGAGTLISKLRNRKELRCSPHLPKGWRSVKISGLTAMGKRYDLAVYSDGRVEVRPAVSK